MVSKARDDLPDPDRPVKTMRRLRGSTRSICLRLCSAAPLMTMESTDMPLLGAFPAEFARVVTDDLRAPVARCQRRERGRFARAARVRLAAQASPRFASRRPPREPRAAGPRREVSDGRADKPAPLLLDKGVQSRLRMSRRGDS